jgi:hypothetical protein
VPSASLDKLVTVLVEIVTFIAAAIPIVSSGCLPATKRRLRRTSSVSSSVRNARNGRTSGVTPSSCLQGPHLSADPDSLVFRAYSPIGIFLVAEMY